MKRPNATARRRIWLAIAALTLVTVDAQARPAADPSLVATDKGVVRGVVRDGVREFKGIPYAAAPTGQLRWRLPRPAGRWAGVLDASQYRSACPQVSRYGLTEASAEEDCLHVNVTVPYAGPGDLKRKRAVIVWIHGGAFVGGSSALYPLAHLAKSGDVVVVSLNYRLGVFGFMAHPGFGRAHNGGYGLEDQRAALRWVKRNIAHFGGDPANVTLAGESAGAASVCMHVLAPNETRGLFHKAIIQSAGCVTPLPSVADGEKVGAKIAALAGCEGKGALDCLRKKKVTDLLDAASKAQGESILLFLPVTGARTVPLPGAEAIPAGRFVKVPVLNGGTRDELRLYVAYDVQASNAVTKDNYEAKLKAVYGDNTAAVIKQYPASDYSSPASALGTVWSDFRADVGINNCIYLQTAKLLRKRVPVYESVFGDRAAPAVTTDPGFEMGAVHSSELPYIFPHFSNTTRLDTPDLAPASQKIADAMVGYWTSFARTGKPTAASAPAWPTFTADGMVMNFTPGALGLFNAGQVHKCGFWKSLYPTILTE
ncbi:carboxylesterase family protein [Xanthobacteraceae bacterium Astr-EGSB]|uniref:carboxylesterase/lipase family protein n=1 Tax=Astrobacterium formosum TaxID=3069710 RepID=UPI0027B0EE74|nr:carboxylesterase family protein [Xanthobacteraceae bacterium Astr-EGSB]